MSKQKTPAFNPGGHKGKLHREMGIPVGQKIPPKRLEQATHSKNPEIARDAKRAETMKGWHHTGPKGNSTAKQLEKRVAKRNDR